MISSLISNKTRIKLLLKFFLNKQNRSYLRSLESEFGGSTNAIRIELKRLEIAGLLQTYVSGNKKYYTANDNHPIFQDINNILKKTLELDKVEETIRSKLHNVEAVFLTGDLARGSDSPIIDLILSGDKLNKTKVAAVTSDLETLINRKIRYLIINKKETEQFFQKETTEQIRMQLI